MVKLSSALSHLRPFSVLVVGDFMLDVYTLGMLRRISPEAPVPVMELLGEEMRPGGAGNVSLNFTSFGAKVLAVGRCGEDRHGEALLHYLQQGGIDTSLFVKESGYPTPVKNRLIAGSQQLMRLDSEKIMPLSPFSEEQLYAQLNEYLPHMQLVAISDYGKGFLSRTLLSRLMTQAKALSIPVLVDPKGADFSKYFGATVLKPNLQEAYIAAQVSLSEPLESVAHILLNVSQAEHLLITRSEQGMSLFHRTGIRTDFAVRSKEVKDVTGAGDTVLAMVGTALANGLGMDHAAQLANLAAGLAIERVGCVQVTFSELASRILEYDVETKLFEENDLYALEQVLKNRSYALLVLEKEELSYDLFRTIRNLAAEQEHGSVLYVHGGRPEDEFLQFLAALEGVHAIVLHSESVDRLLREAPPQRVIHRIVPPPKHNSP